MIDKLVILVLFLITLGCDKMNAFKSNGPSEKRIIELLKAGSNLDGSTKDISHIKILDNVTKELDGALYGFKGNVKTYTANLTVEIVATANCYLRLKESYDPRALYRPKKSKIPACVVLESLAKNDQEQILKSTDYIFKNKNEILKNFQLDSLSFLCDKNCSNDENWKFIINPKYYFEE